MEDSLPQEEEQLPFPMAWTAEAVEGWLMLENVEEAVAELARFPSEFRHHPTVLGLEWKTATAAGKPAQAWRAAEELCELRPHSSGPWICQANALRDVRGPQAAADVLLCVVEKFPFDPIIPYNLACFLAQVGEWERTCFWLMEAFEREPGKQLKELALLDPDLRPLWERIGENFAAHLSAAHEKKRAA